MLTPISLFSFAGVAATTPAPASTQHLGEQRLGRRLPGAARDRDDARTAALRAPRPPARDRRLSCRRRRWRGRVRATAAASSTTSAAAPRVAASAVNRWPSKRSPRKREERVARRAALRVSVDDPQRRRQHADRAGRPSLAAPVPRVTSRAQRRSRARPELPRHRRNERSGRRLA